MRDGSMGISQRCHEKAMPRHVVCISAGGDGLDCAIRDLYNAVCSPPSAKDVSQESNISPHSQLCLQ